LLSRNTLVRSSGKPSSARHDDRQTTCGCSRLKLTRGENGEPTRWAGRSRTFSTGHPTFTARVDRPADPGADEAVGLPGEILFRQADAQLATTRLDAGGSSC
jgi:hypothetical protein